MIGISGLPRITLDENKATTLEIALGWDESTIRKNLPSPASANGVAQILQTWGRRPSVRAMQRTFAAWCAIRRKDGKCSIPISSISRPMPRCGNRARVDNGALAMRGTRPGLRQDRPESGLQGRRPEPLDRGADRPPGRRRIERNPAGHRTMLPDLAAFPMEAPEGETWRRMSAADALAYLVAQDAARRTREGRDEAYGLRLGGPRQSQAAGRVAT